MTGLVPVIHVTPPRGGLRFGRLVASSEVRSRHDVDDRDKPGHDGVRFCGVLLGRIQGLLAGGALVFALALSISPTLAQTASLGIVEPSGNPKPEYSKAADPSAADLIETWRSANQNMQNKRVDRERFE